LFSNLQKKTKKSGKVNYFIRFFASIVKLFLANVKHFVIISYLKVVTNETQGGSDRGKLKVLVGGKLKVLGSDRGDGCHCHLIMPPSCNNSSSFFAYSSQINSHWSAE
jgi:hypothetical protein